MSTPATTAAWSFSVFNAGPGPVHLARGDDCFLIWYADLDRETALAKSGLGFHNIPTKLMNPIAGEIQSLAELLAKIEATEKRMDTISHEQNLVRVKGLIIVAALVGWFIRGATVLRAVPAVPAIGRAAPAPAVPTGRADPRPALPTQPLTHPEGSATTIPPQAPQPATPRQ